jgi:hypothetical protein
MQALEAIDLIQLITVTGGGGDGTGGSSTTFEGSAEGTVPIPGVPIKAKGSIKVTSETGEAGTVMDKGMECFSRFPVDACLRLAEISTRQAKRTQDQ